MSSVPTSASWRKTESGSGPVASLPTGIVEMFAGAAVSVPVGWLLCDGQAVSRATYADLFTLIGITYGPGDGVTTFNVPDMRAAVPIGLYSGDVAIDTLGELGFNLRHDHGSHANHDMGSVLLDHGTLSHTAHSAHAGGAVDAHAGTAVDAHSAHAGGAVDAHSAHAGGAVDAHAVTQPNAHANHVVTQPATHNSVGGHTHDNHTKLSNTTTGGAADRVVNPVTHTNQGAHTHAAHTGTAVDAHSAHAGTAVANHAFTQPSGHANHAFTQPSGHANHVVTQPSNHVFTQPSAHAAHTDHPALVHAGIAAHTAHTNLIGFPYLVLHFIIKT